MEQKLRQALKKNNLEEIVSIMVLNTKEMTLSQKVNLMIENLCSLSPRTIEHLIPMFNIKNDFGTPMSIYTKSVECSPEVFGFVNSYYSPSLIQRKRAYVRALYLNKKENIKKIKGLDSKTLKDLRNYFDKVDKEVTDDMKKRVYIDYKKSVSEKDTSPEDFLKKKIVHRINKNLNFTSSLKL